ncbi:MAG TPA: NADH-quinone oxidoreductase subunit N [Verrucomicrobiales bacterium]|nr:NADH-quinone oxidoreductase subunit N [Verrucomicrobiales bacterium]
MDYALLFKRLLPEAILAATALAVLAADLALWSRLTVSFRKTLGALGVLVGCVVAWRVLGRRTEAGFFYNGLWVADPSISFLKQVMIGLAAGTAWLSRESDFTRHVGEYFALLLLGTIGMLCMVSTENLLLAFVSLELLSLSLYLMTAFAKDRPSSAEAALKYFLFGGVSAAAMLFGFSLLFGVTGDLQLADMAAHLAGKPVEPVLLLGMVLVAAGLGFKVAAVPFHLWAPDAYEAAPTSTAAFVASGSKVASFYLLARVVIVGLQSTAGSAAYHAFVPGWVPLLAVLAAASVVIGNLAAITQRSFKRLLAFSAVAHAGYILLGLVANRGEGAQALVYYVVTYAVTSLGAFGVVAVVERATGSDSIEGLAGLSRRAPWLAGCLAVFLLSLAGIPPLAGFFGKFYLFSSALNAKDHPLGTLWLVGLAIGMSCVALYYYLVVLKQMFVAAPPEKSHPIRMRWATWLVLTGCALLILLWGCFPQMLLSRFPLVTGR